MKTIVILSSIAVLATLLTACNKNSDASYNSSYNTNSAMGVASNTTDMMTNDMSSLKTNMPAGMTNNP